MRGVYKWLGAHPNLTPLVQESPTSPRKSLAIGHHRDYRQPIYTVIVLAVKRRVDVKHRKGHDSRFAESYLYL